MPSILFISYGHIRSPFLPGGGALRIHKLAQYLSENFDVTVVSGNFPGAEKVKEKYKSIFIGSSSSPYASLISFSLLIPKLIASEGRKYDIVIEDFAPFFSSFSPLFAKSVIQFQIYGGKEIIRRFPPPFGFIFYFNEFFYHRMFKYGVFVYESLVKRFRWDRSSGKEYSVIWSGVDEENFSYAPVDGEYILFMGRLSLYMKGLDIFLHAIDILSGDGLVLPPIVIVGDGPDTAKLKEMAQKLISRRKVNIKFTGWVDDARKKALLYSKCMFSVLPSRYEGFGLSILEAASFGKASVISDIPEFSWARHFCLTFKKGNALELALKMKKMIVDKDLRSELGLMARAFAKEKTWRKSAEKFAEFLLRI